MWPRPDALTTRAVAAFGRGCRRREEGAALAFDVLAVPLRHPPGLAIGQAIAQFVFELCELELAEFLARPQRLQRLADEFLFIKESTGEKSLFDEFLQFAGKS